MSVFVGICRSGCYIKSLFLLAFKTKENNNKLIIMNVHLLFLGNLGAGEILIVALIVLLLFGGKKIPELMKGIGKGVKSFRDGVKDIEDEIKIN